MTDTRDRPDEFQSSPDGKAEHDAPYHQREPGQAGASRSDASGEHSLIPSPVARSPRDVSEATRGRLSGPLVAARRAVEFCGKHPFATGLFALLSLVGLALSVVSLRYDRQVAALSSSQTEQLSRDLAALRERESAARMDSVSRPVAISDVSAGEDSWVFPGVAGGGPLYSLTSRRDGISTNNTFFFTITSDAERYHVQVAPYLVVDVLEVHRLPEPTAAVYQGERGAGAVIREFVGALEPQIGRVVAPHVVYDEETEELRRPQLDYFTLAPGESEVFALYLNYIPGYVYAYRIGVQYRHQGRNAVEWLPATYRRGVPDGQVAVYGWTDDYDMEFHPDRTAPDETLKWSRRGKELLRSSRLFSLEQIAVVR